jgi:hypothetical protein
MLDCIEVDRTQLESGLDGMRALVNGEGLQQPQYLHVLAAAMLLQSHFP